jgi:acyl-CoA synthetase (AMP-forming)/AMP-acid ligase II
MTNAFDAGVDGDPPPSTLVDLLRRRARSQPDQVAFSFLAGGERDALRLTYGELDRQARAIAGLLTRQGVLGERALLLLPPGPDHVAAFFGCVYAGVVAVPAYPPGPDGPGPHLRAIAADARARVVLCTASVRDDLGVWLPAPAGAAAPLRVAVDEVGEEAAGAWRDPGVAPQALALLQYTRGPTAPPRGVMLTHANLLANCALLGHCLGDATQAHGLTWLPPHHPVGLVGGILRTIHGGHTTTILSPGAFLRRPARWLQAIARCGATLSGAVPLAYELCARRVTARERAGLDLGCWQLAVTGPIARHTIERFLEAFGPAGFRREAFYPCYGLPEATLLVTAGQRGEPPIYLDVEADALRRRRVVLTTPDDRNGRVLVGCGRGLPGTKVVVVDPATCRPCPRARVGEIWVKGPGVARGYWGRPRDSERVFGAYLADNGDGPYLRTGDLGFLHEGELFITGRLGDRHTNPGGAQLADRAGWVLHRRAEPAVAAGVAGDD